MASFAEEDDFDSDTSDEDYVPCGEGEALSEEEHSGEDEDFLAGDEDSTIVTGKRRKGKGKRKNKSENLVRKRTGGIKLEGEESENQNTENKVAEETDSYNKELAAQIEKEKTLKKEAEEKNKADSLWADFMSDVGSHKPKPKATSGGLGSLSSLSKPTGSPSTAKTVAPSSVSSPTVSAAASSSPSTGSSKVTITKEYDFAGETVKISKEVDANSKEAKAEMKKQEKHEEKANLLSGPNLSGLKRPAGGLGSVLGKIGKKPKMSTLEKSKLDWNSFKEKEGIEEELQIHNRGKSGYIERKEFLERTDMRQFERERDIRLKMMNSKR